ncbi:MAG: hypothetical protein ACJAYJ_002170 [Saprospiraceae bacterium]|jgi:hypothetical protein
MVLEKPFLSLKTLPALPQAARTVFQEILCSTGFVKKPFIVRIKPIQ